MRNVLVLTLFVALTAANAPGEAQTLTPTRGVFAVPNARTLKAKEEKLAVVDSVVLSLLVDGSVRTVLTGKSGDAPSPAAGAVGVAFGRYNSNLTIMLNVVGSVDSVKREFGTSLLSPTSGGATANRLSFLADYRRLFNGSNGTGMHVYLSGAPMAWVDTTPSAPKQERGLALGAGAQLSREVYYQEFDNSTTVGLIFDAGVVARSIHGDLSSPRSDALRSKLLGTNRRSFIGAELGATLQVREVRLGVSYYLFGGDVPGLSKGQAVFGFAVANSIFSSRAAKKEAP